MSNIKKALLNQIDRVGIKEALLDLNSIDPANSREKALMVFIDAILDGVAFADDGNKVKFITDLLVDMMVKNIDFEDVVKKSEVTLVTAISEKYTLDLNLSVSENKSNAMGAGVTHH